jgi:glycosyltransferase involved in cell wall biosynthesis
MRILVVTGIYPPEIGGPATYVPRAAVALHNEGSGVQILTLSDHKPVPLGPGIPVHVVPRSWWRPVRGLSLWVTAAKLARQTDIILACGLFGISAFVARVTRRPLVMRVVGDDAWERSQNRQLSRDDFVSFQRRRQSWRVEILKFLRSWAARTADAVIVPSEFLANVARSWGVPEDRISTINNGIELPVVVPPGRGEGGSPFSLVTSGRLVAHKRIDGILRAVAQIPLASLVVIGDGPERLRLKAHVHELGLQSRVKFVGKLPPDEAVATVVQSDVFVLNSTYEGMPHVVIEAMAVGVPVVATSVGGTGEIITDGEDGILVSPDDHDALVAALSTMAKDLELRNRLAVKAKQRAQYFSSARMMAQTSDLLRTIATSSTHA